MEEKLRIREGKEIIYEDNKGNTLISHLCLSVDPVPLHRQKHLQSDVLELKGSP